MKFFHLTGLANQVNELQKYLSQPFPAVGLQALSQLRLLPSLDIIDHMEPFYVPGTVHTQHVTSALSISDGGEVVMAY